MLMPTPDDPMSIFTDGNLKPGVYKIQNLACQTFLGIQEHSKGLCCRPAAVLSPQDASWEFEPLGSGYKIKKVGREKPDQFCTASEGLFFGFGSAVIATAFPVAWRVELVDEIQYRGLGYVRIFWGSTNKALDLPPLWGASQGGTKVTLWEDMISVPWRIWKLIPVQENDPPTGPDTNKDDLPPSYFAK